MNRLRGTLYSRISVALLAILALLGVVQFFLFFFLWQRITDESEQRLNWGLAADLAPRFERLLVESYGYDDLLNLSRDVIAANPEINVYLLDALGNIALNLSAPNTVVKQVSLAPVSGFLSGKERDSAPLYGQDPLNPKREVVFSAAPVRLGNEPGYLYLTFGSERRKALRTLLVQSSTLPGSITYLGSSLVIAALAGLVLFYYMTKRFHRVTEVVRKFERGDFSERLHAASEDEIDQLARAVNKMADTITANIAELESRDERRRDLIANISHDLRGPVTNISTYLDSLLEKGDLLTGKILDQLRVVRKNTDSLSRLLTELFELARLEARDKRLTLETFAVDEMLHDLVLAHREKAANLALTLVDNTEGQIPPVTGDIALIERALSNLLDNALHYTPEGGAVTVRASREGARVRIEISDTGVGIAEKDLPHVFDRFFRVQTVKPRGGVSTGLGLAIVQNIVRAHDSQIDVTSTLGVGTTFTFTLAAAEGSPRSD